MMNEDRIYAGKVTRVTTNQAGYHYATVNPIAVADSLSSKWEDLPGSITEDFPNRGLVFWHNPPPNVAENTYWEFRLEEVEGWGSDERKKEKYQIVDPRGLVEILDLKEYDDAEEELREAFTSSGLFLPKKPLSSKLYLLISDKEMLGPVSLKEIGDDRWCIDGGIDSEKLVDLQVMRPPIDRLKDIHIDEKKRLFTPPGGYDGTAIVHKNWEPYNVLLRRVFRRLASYDQVKAHELGIGTKKIIDEFIDNVDRMGLIGVNLQKEIVRKDRLGELFALIESNREFHDEALMLLGQSGALKVELDRYRETAYEKIKAEEEERVKTLTEGKRKELASLEDKIRAKADRLTQVEEAISEEKKKLEQKVKAFEDEYLVRLRELSESPEKIFADFALFKNVFSNFRSDSDEKDAALKYEEIFPAHDNVQVLTEINEMVGSLELRMRAERMENGTARRILASFLSGKIPLICGNGALSALTAVADALAGGRMVWVPVPASYYEPQDLFGRITADGRFNQNASGLLSTLRFAQEKNNEFILVVLDGFNKSSADSYLMPILKSVQASATGKKLQIPLSVRVVSDGSSVKDQVARVAWPRNVLLALIPSPKEIAVPVSKEVLEAIVPLVCVVASESYVNGQLPVDTGIPLTAASPSAWFDKIKIDLTSREHETEPGKLERLRREAGISFNSSYGELFRAARRAGMDVESSVEFSISSGIVPLLVREKRKIEEILGKAGINVDKSIKQMQSLVSEWGG